MFEHHGKQVLRDGQHFADAATPEGAELIVKACSAYRKRIRAGTQSKGGVARAAALSPEQRSAIARTAAQARWGKKP